MSGGKEYKILSDSEEEEDIESAFLAQLSRKEKKALLKKMMAKEKAATEAGAADSSNSDSDSSDSDSPKKRKRKRKKSSSKKKKKKRSSSKKSKKDKVGITRVQEYGPHTQRLHNLVYASVHTVSNTHLSRTVIYLDTLSIVCRNTARNELKETWD